MTLLNIDLTLLNKNMEIYIENYYKSLDDNFKNSLDDIYDIRKTKKSEDNFKNYTYILEEQIYKLLVKRSLDKIQRELNIKIALPNKKKNSEYNTNVLKYPQYECINHQIRNSQILSVTDDSIVYKIIEKNNKRVIKVTDLNKYVRMSVNCKYNIANCLKNIINISHYVGNKLGVGPKMLKNEICQTNNGLFHSMEMEFIDGVRLDKFLDDKTIFDSTKKEVLKKVKVQLDKLKKKYIMHNDIDTKNFVVITDKDGKSDIKILDYNLSESLEYVVTSKQFIQNQEIYKNIYEIDIIDYVICKLIQNNDIKIKF
jgi:hypothetical protein